MTEDKKLSIKFMPGCFDDFEGTQEELNELVAELTRLAETGEFEKMGEPIDLSDLEDTEELEDALQDVVKTLIQSENKTLH